MFAYDLQGRPLFNVSLADPPLRRIYDLVLAPGPDGEELIVLDPINSRLVAVARNGSVSAFPLPAEVLAHDFITDMEYADNGDVYVSARRAGSGTQLRANSSVWRVDRQGRVVDRFVAGDQWPESRLSAITARGDDLYAYDVNRRVIFVWRNRQLRAELGAGVAREAGDAVEWARSSSAAVTG